MSDGSDPPISGRKKQGQNSEKIRNINSLLWRKI